MYHAGNLHRGTCRLRSRDETNRDLPRRDGLGDQLAAAGTRLLDPRIPVIATVTDRVLAEAATHWRTYPEKTTTTLTRRRCIRSAEILLAGDVYRLFFRIEYPTRGLTA